MGPLTTNIFSTLPLFVHILLKLATVSIHGLKNSMIWMKKSDIGDVSSGFQNNHKNKFTSLKGYQIR